MHCKHWGYCLSLTSRLQQSTLAAPQFFSVVEEGFCGKHPDPKMAKLRSHLIALKLRNSQLLPEGLGHAVFLVVREADAFHSLKTFLSQYTIQAFTLYTKYWKTREWSGRGWQWFTPELHGVPLSVSGVEEQKLMQTKSQQQARVNQINNTKQKLHFRSYLQVSFPYLSDHLCSPMCLFWSFIFATRGLFISI